MLRVEEEYISEYVVVSDARMHVARIGLKRCGKSCRLRWMNYLRPGVKRGNISDDEEDLIIRLHKLLGNRCCMCTCILSFFQGSNLVCYQ